MGDTWLDIVTDALIEIGSYAPGDDIAAEHIALAQRHLARIIDQMAARRVFAFTRSFLRFTLTPGHQPHLIGPTAAAPDFAASARPVEICGAALVLTDATAAVDSPIIRIRDARWWNNQRVKGLQTSIPTDLWPEMTAPNVSLWFWPVPDYAYDVRIQVLASLGLPVDVNGDVDLTQDFVAPQGYNGCVMLKLAKALCRAMSRPLTADLIAAEAEASRAVLGNNIKSPRIGTAGYGTNRRGDFNYSTGDRQ